MLRERDMDDRTEEPTPRRREEARRAGEAPRSTGLVLGLALLASFGSLAWAGPGAAAGIRLLFTDLLASAVTPGLDASHATALLSGTVAAAGVALLPVIGISVAGALVAGACRGGAGFHPGSVGFAWRGRQRGGAGGDRSLGALERVVALAIAIPLFAAGAVSAFDAGAEVLARDGVGPAAVALAGRISWIGLRVAAVIVVLGLAGRLAARWRHERSLRMTRNELREERDLVEGNPLWKHERRRAEARVRSAREGGR